MFEKLGFDVIHNLDSIIYEKRNPNLKGIRVYFDLKGKKFCAMNGFNIRSVSVNEFKAICKQCEELGWIEKEKQETNLEHHFEYLSIVGMGGFALINGKCARCSDTGCTGCDFNGDCCKKRLIWLASSYRKPTFKLTQFEYDLVHTYSDCNENCKFEDCEQLKRLKDKGYFKQIDNDELIENILTSCEVSE